jgi:hypothetical protein
MSDSVFDKGLKLDVTKHIEKKGKFNYLSWPFAVQELRKLDPKATWYIGSEFKEEPIPYIQSEAGCFVEVTVVLGDETRYTQIHPVLDNRNQPISKPNAFQINTSIQRCLVKAIAIASGIGLHIYAGEDLPPSDDIANKVLDTFPDSKEVMGVMEFDEQLSAAKTKQYKQKIWEANWLDVKPQCGPVELEQFKKIYDKEIKK